MREDLQAEVERRLRTFALELVELIDAPASRPDFKKFAYRDVLTTEEAGKIANIGAEAARGRCVQAEQVGRPIGRKLGRDWLVLAPLLLEDIEQRDGEYARLEAETRLKTLRTWADAPENDE